ncbi:RHS repeat-associated core domain-containing protein [Paenimyroides ceti]
MVEHSQSQYYGNQYKFNGKELDSTTGMYYYGARYYEPRFSIFVSVDPLAEKTMTPYQYVNNNPIMLVDPTGMRATPPTDFVDINSGKITTIDDGVDQTIALDGTSINAMQEMFNLNKDAYSDKLSELSNSDLNLNMNRSQFMFFAETLYAESSGGFEESLGIVNVLENRAANEGNSVRDQLSASPPYGVYGVWKTSSGKNSKYKYSYMNEMGAYGSEQKRNNMHRAIAVGLTTAKDVSNGAYFWDGTDITTNSHYKSWGVQFSNSSHNLWGLKDTFGSAQLKTTNAIGKTTFTKFLNQGKKWFISK